MKIRRIIRENIEPMTQDEMRKALESRAVDVYKGFHILSSTWVLKYNGKETETKNYCFIYEGKFFPEEVYQGLTSIEDTKERIDQIIKENPDKFKMEEAFDDDEIKQSEQEFTSAKTSINSAKLPAIFRLVKFIPDTINLDYGGGKFDNASEYLLDMYNVTNLIYDPFNRSTEHNREVLRTIRNNKGADSATLSNVLNVIKEPSIRIEVLENIKRLLKPNAPLYITVFEGTGNSQEGETKSGYQLNKKTADYVEEICQVFDDVTRKGKLIIAK